MLQACVSHFLSKDPFFLLNGIFLQFVQSVRICKNSFWRLWCVSWYSLYFSDVGVNVYKSRNCNWSIATLLPAFYIICSIAKNCHFNLKLMCKLKIIFLYIFRKTSKHYLWELLENYFSFPELSRFTPIYPGSFFVERVWISSLFMFL